MALSVIQLISRHTYKFFARGQTQLDQALAVVAHQYHARCQGCGANVGLRSATVYLGSNRVIGYQ